MALRGVQVQLAWERRSVPNPDVNALLDWLLISLPADQLPERFAAGSKTNAVSLVQRGGVSLASVARLMAHGYSSTEAEAALVAAAGDEEAAMLALYAGLTGGALNAGNTTLCEASAGRSLWDVSPSFCKVGDPTNRTERR